MGISKTKELAEGGTLFPESLGTRTLLLFQVTLPTSSLHSQLSHGHRVARETRHISLKTPKAGSVWL